tara:strand:+ start:226 stop:828 length:603 start_codon:yes stop_codon:yes gene_type:complete
MITPIQILEVMGVLIAGLGVLGMFIIILSMGKRLKLFRQMKKPSLPLPLVLKTKKKIRRTEKMSKEKGEGVTFNDVFMFMIAVPLVLLWVGFAGAVIYTGLNDDTGSVLGQIESYTTLIAILGGPALLIIKDALDVWKQEQAEKTAFYKIKAQAVIDYNDSTQRQDQMIQTNAQTQAHKIESEITDSKTEGITLPIKGKK